jgi:DNA (cytosine-5)-methyltransferase 1
VSDVYFEGYERTVTKASPNRGVGLPLWAERIRLLPTPTIMETKASTNPEVIDKFLAQKRQNSITYQLLRTPTAAEVEGGPVSPEVAKAKGQTLRLTGQVLALREWGEFEPAIRRWEAVTGNHAPEPTLADGQKGQHRLNARFTEWMMGLVPGWITGHGLSRKDEIKMAGNGVVPQQAVFALSLLLERLEK